MKLALPVELDGFTGTIRVVAEKQNDGSLQGEWVLTGNDGVEVMRDSWRATRQ